MRIAVCSTISRNAGGLFYSVRYLSRALEELGCSQCVISPRDRFSDEDVLHWAPLETQPYSGAGPLQISLKMRSLLADTGADLIHVHGIWQDQQWAALQWQRKTRRPVVVSPRGMLDPWALKNGAWKKKLVSALFADEALRRASCIHALCRSEAESVRAYGLGNPIAVIPNGVVLPELEDSSEPEESRTLLFLGRIHPKKGLTELIQAWSEPSGAWRKEWKLLIAGWDDGGHEKGLKRLVQSLGLQESISFVGPAFGREKERLLRRADAFVLPSFSEGLPMSVLEAWSYRLPVIMTDHCNLPEGFSFGAAVRVAPEEASIAAGLDQLTRMSIQDRSAMAWNGRKLVEQKFSWPKIAAQMKLVYEWCLTGKNPPKCMEFK